MGAENLPGPPTDYTGCGQFWILSIPILGEDEITNPNYVPLVSPSTGNLVAVDTGGPITPVLLITRALYDQPNHMWLVNAELDLYQSVNLDPTLTMGTKDFDPNNEEHLKDLASRLYKELREDGWYPQQESHSHVESSLPAASTDTSESSEDSKVVNLADRKKKK